MLKLGFTFKNRANYFLHKSTDAKFYPITGGDKNLLEKVRKDIVGCPSTVFTRKQLLMKLLFEKQQIYGNLLLGMTLVNYTPTRCVNPCPQVFIRVGISTQRRVDLSLDKTRPAACKIWSCLIFNDQDQNVKMKAS